ncbi:MAG: SUMF1/EgtB/PvdO family nonheme iron enzyme, partial [Bacteroidales bacterium]|nr:SUMF1/EgtB/PvdO family nonheme iron enzyme [Bacteroidales bacterium]
KDKEGNYKIINIKYSEIFDNLIDISVWKDNPEFENYFTDKAFDNYPVTGVNYTSAMYYCWWRSKKENEKNKNKEYLVVYRLALEIEWAYVAYSGTGNNIQGLSPIRPQKVKSGKPNLFGLYNLYGNAAELVSTNDYETAKIMTYSWLNTSPDEASKTVDRNYRDNVTGFRIVRTFLGIKK